MSSALRPSARSLGFLMGYIKSKFSRRGHEHLFQKFKATGSHTKKEKVLSNGVSLFSVSSAFLWHYNTADECHARFQFLHIIAVCPF